MTLSRLAPFLLAPLIAGVLTVAGCAASPTKLRWALIAPTDSMVVRQNPPDGSGLPEARPDSFKQMAYRLVVTRSDSNDPASPLAVLPMDREKRPNPEPADLDILVRIEGAPGTWIKGLDVLRYYTPIGVPDGTGMVLHVHAFNWTHEESSNAHQTLSFGDADQAVEGDVYLEFSLADRGEFDDGSWFLVQRVRYRFRSRHEGWQFSDTRLNFISSEGVEFGVDLFLPDAD